MIGKTSIVKTVDIGENTNIGEFCLIDSPVSIGHGTTIKDYVEIREGTTICNECYIDSRVSFSGREERWMTEIEDLVTIRYSAIIAKGVLIKKSAFISPQVMFIYSDARGLPPVDRTVIKENVFIGTASVINSGVMINSGVTVAPMTFVRDSILDPGLYGGIPARRLR